MRVRVLGFYPGSVAWERSQGVALERVLIYLPASRSVMTLAAMRTATREKFSSQATPEALAALRKIASVQSRQFQAVLDEALRDGIG